MPKIIIITICLIAAVGLVIFLVYPKYQDLAFLRKQLKQKGEEFSSRQEYFSEVNRVSEELNNYQEELEKIDSALPEDPSLPEIYDYFQKVSSQNGLVLTNINVGPLVDSKANLNTKETGISIAVSGSYTALKNLLSSLYKSARLIEVENISFSPEEGSIFEFNLQLKTHSYSPSMLGAEIDLGVPAEME